MRLTRKIPAFTLTEMLVVMAITAIVAGLAFTILSLFGRNIQLIGSNYSHSTKLNLFEDQLAVDFNRFHSIVYDADLDELKLKTPIDSISYSFSDGLILRGLDTLLTVKTTKQLYLMGNEVERGFIDALKINLRESKPEKFIFLHKENDANFYITQNGN
jgi:prepilin-type N-terminal cleavage/methylation domain-containing protein